MKRIIIPFFVGAFLFGNLTQAFAESAYSLESGTGHVVTVASSVAFYDDGGNEANITPGFSGTVTFVPEKEGKVLMLSTDDFSIGGGKMFVYSGREVLETNILGKVTGYSTTSGPVDLISKASDGSLTVDFKAHASASTLRGWVMSVMAMDAVPMDVASVEVTDGMSEEVVRGACDVPVAHLAVTVAGNSGNVVLKGIDVDFGASTSVSDVKNVKVFYTGTNEEFAPVNELCDVPRGLTEGKADIDFGSPVVIDEAGTFHLWIAAELNVEAVPGNRVSAILKEVKTSGSAVAIPESDSGNCTLKAGLGGTFRIGASESADYPTIGEAVAALAGGVENTVLFMIEDGEYKENISIVNVQGGSPSHPVVFSSLSGNRDKVVISGAEVLADRGIVTIDNSSFVNLRNLTVSVPESSSSGKPYAAVLFRNGSRHCSVENCIINAMVASTIETSLVRTADGGRENTNCDYLTIKNSYFEGGYIALYLSGTGMVAYPKTCGLSVTDNMVNSPYFKGIYVNDCQDFTLSGNTVKSETAKKSYNAIDIYRPHGAYRVTGNKVSMLQPTDGTGIYLRTSGGISDPLRRALVANNVVAVPNASAAYTYGIMLDASLTNLLVAHNSVSITGASTLKSVFALAFSGTAPAEEALQLSNNILQNSTAGGPLRPWNSSHYANIEFSGNVYYGGGEAMDGDGNTFAVYAEAAGDNTSLWKPVAFFSEADLHLREADEDMAMPRLEAVVTDAEGTERPALTTPGAYEFAPVVAVTPEIMEGYPAIGVVKDVSATVNTRWTIGGSLYSKAVKASDTPPTREELLVSRPITGDADIEIAATFNFLDQLTPYKAYFLMVSALGEESQIIVSEEFTTSETIEPLSVVIDWDEEAVNAGETIVLQAYPIGGKEPYTYTWLDQMNRAVGSTDLFTHEAAVNQTYRVEVASADGQTARAKALVEVIAPTLSAATFDDLPLEAESKWIYDSDATDETYVDAFFSGSFRFGNFPMVEWQVWSGYGYANETETSFNNDYSNQMRNVVGGGALESANYGVAYMMMADMRIQVSADDKGLQVPGVYITNAAVTAEKILQGDGFCPKFTAENDDYMTLKIYGYGADGEETGVVDVPLADYRGEYGEAGGYLLAEWKWFDLSALGAVKTLKFAYESSQQDMVPAYVCFDQLGAADPSSGVDGTVVADSDLRLYIPARDCLTVSGVEGAYTLCIYTADGVRRAIHALNGAATVSTSGVPVGVCIAEVVGTDGSRRVLRFMKR